MAVTKKKAPQKKKMRVKRTNMETKRDERMDLENAPVVQGKHAQTRRGPVPVGMRGLFFSGKR